MLVFVIILFLIFSILAIVPGFFGSLPKGQEIIKVSYHHDLE